MQLADFLDSLSYLSMVSVVLPLVFYINIINIAIRRTHIIGGFLLISALCDILAMMIRWQGTNSIVINMYYIMTFVLLSWFFHEIVFRMDRKRWFQIGSTIYTGALVVLLYVNGGWNQFQGLLWALGGLILIVYGVQFSNHVMANLDFYIIYPYLLSSIVFVIAIMFYFLINLYLFISSSYMLTAADTTEAMTIWAYHNGNNIVKNVLFAFGMAYTGKYFKEQGP